ncbi:hypothetical protein PALB_13760 [Pseudoalteromonas luteoviolacea B = ATCC 29581]|nr:hypothetical protein PALB_13760 [Pseudoalteromonas luteoviolacea B = ATCC 29581]
MLITTLMALGVMSAPVTELHDIERGRVIPIQITEPNLAEQCSSAAPCKVALIGAGYGLAHTHYQFIVNALKERGFLSVSIGHELPIDPFIALHKPYIATRAENWHRGAESLKFVRAELKNQFEQYDFDNLWLFGHSNGGDISAWYSNIWPQYVEAVVTLDSRRVPLPRNRGIKVFTIRASDFPADPTVLYEHDELKKFSACVITIPNALHNEMSDSGPSWLTEKMNQLIKGYIDRHTCDTLAQTISD